MTCVLGLEAPHDQFVSSSVHSWITFTVLTFCCSRPQRSSAWWVFFNIMCDYQTSKTWEWLPEDLSFLVRQLRYLCLCVCALTSFGTFYPPLLLTSVLLRQPEFLPRGINTVTSYLICERHKQTAISLHYTGGKANIYWWILQNSAS